jgi:Protein of unknown function (DUF3455)
VRRDSQSEWTLSLEALKEKHVMNDFTKAARADHATTYATAFALAAALAASSVACAVDVNDAANQNLGRAQLPRDEARSALAELALSAPKNLPQNTPAVLLQLENGKVDLGALITNQTQGALPSARIVSAFRTTDTPSETSKRALANGVKPTYESSAPAAQVYECIANKDTGALEWTFTRPEAGLVPITEGNKSIRGLDQLIFDHFLFPGGIDVGQTASPPKGPAWRVSAPALDRDLEAGGQAFFVGAVDLKAKNGDLNIPLLRVRNVAFVNHIDDPKVQSLPFAYSGETSKSKQLGFVLRLNTQGGLAPTGTCSKDAKPVRSPYATEYYFVELTTAL